ncbi:MAG: cell division protein ZapB [Treponema sp.]|nr:cell division protein ZapB [Treponema sp.]
MVSLEHVQLLESRVAKAIEYIQRLDNENSVLSQERQGLQAKLDANQKRLDELELLVMRFKEDQGKIEDGIMAALDRLSQFEEAFEKSLASRSQEDPGSKKGAVKKEKPSDDSKKDLPSDEFFEINGKETEVNAGELDIF